MAACFAFCHWMILRSKRPSNPKSPATSAVDYGLFARAQSVFLLATGILLSCDHCRLHRGCGLPSMMSQTVSASRRAGLSKRSFRDSVESRNGTRKRSSSRYARASPRLASRAGRWCRSGRLRRVLSAFSAPPEAMMGVDAARGSRPFRCVLLRSAATARRILPCIKSIRSYCIGDQ